MEDSGELTATNSFQITVNGSNDDPVLTGNAADLADATEDTDYTITVDQLLAGFTDADASDVLTVEGLTAFIKDVNGDPTNEVAGSFTKQINNNGEITAYVFKPFKDVNGEIELQYVVADGNGPGTPSQYDLTIEAVNDGPQLGELPNTGLIVATLQEDQVVRIKTKDIIDGFYDPDNIVLNYAITSGLQIFENSITSPNGSVQLGGVDANGDNIFIDDDGDEFYTFVPDNNFNGSTELEFTIQDAGGELLTVNKFVEVQAVNDLPTITLSGATTNNDGLITNAGTNTFSIVGGTAQFLSINDFGYSDVEGDPLAYVRIQLPDPDIASLYLGSAAYSTEGKQIINASTYADAVGINYAEVRRADIVGNRLFIETTFTSIGREETLTFDVSDSTDPSQIIWSSNDGAPSGEIEFTVTGAPQS